MKTIIISGMAFFMAVSTYSQNINWGSLTKEQKHIANVNMALDYGTTIGIGYGYQLNTKIPIVLNSEFSVPFGDKLLDDFKTKIGGNIKLYEYKGFTASAKIQGVFRRYENELVRLLNFGSDISAIVGYYRPKWYAAGEVGFDKAIVTHFKHWDLYKENYPQVKDGWYEPATGGNFYYGLQGGYSFKKSDVYLRVGKLLEEDFKTSPMLPFYAQLGYNIRF